MRILLCNDDGYQALGIQVLAAELKLRGHEVVLVAPSEERSGQSHAMSFFRPVLVRNTEPNVYSVSGSPADCAAIALLDLLKKTPPDLVVSGINHGLNVGWDVNYSGTVGAATEAVLLGYKAIAVSVDLDGAKSAQEVQKCFENAAKLTAEVVEQITSFEWPLLEVLNINHPGMNCKGVTTAACGAASIYVPNLQRLEAQGIRSERTAVYMIGGNERRSTPDQSQDVSLIQQGFATLSFLQTRQSSTQNTAKLSTLAKGLPE